jgi:hypothetical protein
MKTKVCTKCKKKKSINEFHKCKKGKNGKKAVCITCRCISASNHRKKIVKKNRLNKPPTPKKRTCPKCKVIKDGTDFYSNLSNVNGISCWCKTCHDKPSREWEQRNPDKLRIKAKASWAKNKNNNIFMNKKRAADTAIKDKNRTAWNKKHIRWYHINQLCKQLNTKKDQIPIEILQLKFAVVAAKRIIRDN